MHTITRYKPFANAIPTSLQIIMGRHIYSTLLLAISRKQMAVLNLVTVQQTVLQPDRIAPVPDYLMQQWRYGGLGR